MTLQDQIDATPTGSVLDLTGQQFIGGAIVDRSMTIGGGSVISQIAGSDGLTISADNVELDGIEIIGPTPSGYVIEDGITTTGTALTPINGLTIRNCNVRNFGYGGLTLKWVNNLLVADNIVEDTGYAGIMVISTKHGVIHNNEVRRVSLDGNSPGPGNAYGIVASHLLPGDDSSEDIVISDNLVENVPFWHAFDTHSGKNIKFLRNTARLSKYGIFITGAAAKRAENIVIVDNVIEALPTGDIGVTAVYCTTVSVIRNTFVRYPANQDIYAPAGQGDLSPIGLVVQDNVNTDIPPTLRPTGLPNAYP